MAYQVDDALLRSQSSIPSPTIYQEPIPPHPNNLTVPLKPPTRTWRLIQNPLNDQNLGPLTCTDTPRNLDQKWVLNKPLGATYATVGMSLDTFSGGSANALR